MSNFINFGIDLGTTNSLIARFSDGAVEVFKNPIGHKETLPSVVAFRKGRLIVGDKAKEYIEKDPANVFAGFKRKMGTAEKFFAADTGIFYTPAELSAMVLKELKNFIYTGETPEAIVITIPASFDTIQSNATKEAGYAAGFSEVVLLQEPVAASLAFANKTDAGKERGAGRWLVYDLGGGTFDVALVAFSAEELKVTDHEGDNFLGGLDFDNLIIEKIIVPHLIVNGSFAGIEKELRSAAGRYNKLYYILLHKAEEAKIELSHSHSTEIDFEVEDEEGESHDFSITITRKQFEACIAPQVQHSISLVKKLLQKNNISSKDITEVVMVGGSTYIPFIKAEISRTLGITVNSTIDPTTAVAAGAAYFAGTRQKKNPVAAAAPTLITNNINCRLGYAKTSKDAEEYLTALFSGELTGLYYRLQRTDGGFDSSLKPLTERISEMLPLLADSNNVFKLQLFDEKNNIVEAGIPLIEIAQGKFALHGQPLPDDICLEVDDAENGATRLEPVFEKNNLLPLKKTIVREVSKMIRKNEDDKLIINVLEGSRYAPPASNLPIGVIEIKGSDLERDLIKGTDIEIVLEINESRDLQIKATLLMTDQEFKNVFTPQQRYVSIERLRNEIKDLLKEVRTQMKTAQQAENYELAAELQQIKETLDNSADRIEAMPADDVTDEKYSLEERKRSCARQLAALDIKVNLAGAIDKYLWAVEYNQQLLATAGTAGDREKLDHLMAEEQSLLASQNIKLIKKRTDDIWRLTYPIRKNRPADIISWYRHLREKDGAYFTDADKAKRYFDDGEKALDRRNYDELFVIVQSLWSIIKEDNDKQFSGTGLA